MKFYILLEANWGKPCFHRVFSTASNSPARADSSAVPHFATTTYKAKTSADTKSAEGAGQVQ